MASSAELCALFAHARIADDGQEIRGCSNHESCSSRKPSLTGKDDSDVQTRGTAQEQALKAGIGAVEAHHSHLQPIRSSSTHSKRLVDNSSYPKVPLRDYQQELYDAVQAKWQNEKPAPLLAYLPTGGGKTHVAAALMSYVLSRGEACCCLFIVNRRCLVEQTMRSLLKLGFPAAAASSIVGDTEEQADAVIHVASIQSLLARHLKEAGDGAAPREFDDDETLLTCVDKVGRVTVPPTCAQGAFQLGRVSHCFIDEAHAAGAQTYRRLMRALPRGARVLGLTATPFRADADASLKDVFPHVLFGPSVSQLIARAVLVPPAVFGPVSSKCMQSKESRGATRAHASSTSLSAATERSLHEAVEAWVAHGGGLPTVAFCARVAESRRLSALLSAAGVVAAHVDGATSSTERRRLVAALRQRELKVLCNCDVLSEGFDEPTVACVVLLDHVHTESRRLYIQQVGRALRPAPGKTRCVVIDCVGATWHHGPITGPIGSDYKWEEQLCSASGRVVSKLIRRCECGALRHLGVDTCPGCGADVLSRRRYAVNNANKAGSAATEASRKPLEALPLNRYRIPKKGGASQQAVASIPSFALADCTEISLPDLGAVSLASDNAVPESAARDKASESTARPEMIKSAAHRPVGKTEGEAISLQSLPARSAREPQPQPQPQIGLITEGPRPDAHPVIAAPSLPQAPSCTLEAQTKHAAADGALATAVRAHPDTESQLLARAHAQRRESNHGVAVTVKQSHAREATRERAAPLPANPARKAHAQKYESEHQPPPTPLQQERRQQLLPPPPLASTRTTPPPLPPPPPTSHPPPPPKTLRPPPSRNSPESLRLYGGKADTSASIIADSVQEADGLRLPEAAIRQNGVLPQSSKMTQSVPPTQKAITACTISIAAAHNDRAQAEPRRTRLTDSGVDEIEAMLGATLSIAPRNLQPAPAASEATFGGHAKMETVASADAPRGASRSASKSAETLPPYWVRAWSATRQREYFFHTKTQEKTWRFPTTAT